MARRILAASSVTLLAALALAACSPSSRDKAKDASEDAAAKVTAVAKDAASEAKDAATQAKDAVEQAAANHGIGVKSTPDFVQAAGVGGIFEIQSSELALKVSKDPAIKRFAHHMITDHTKLAKGLKAAVDKSGLTVAIPGELDADHQSKLDDLKNAAPGDFDRKYLDAQRGGHEEALGIFKAYADKGSDAAIKDAAASAVPVMQGHLDEVKALQKAQDDKKSTGSGKKM